MYEDEKAALLKKQTELENSLRERDDIVIDPEPDAIDEVVNAAQRELAIRNHDRETDLLKKVRSALQRITEGDYGTCLHCENPISPKRLKAVPWAAFCLPCQERKDRLDQKNLNQFPNGEDAAA